ncbi:hypothetical protein C0Q70_02942 [Pomacea canaliculata]|uniref:Uncharacterized protein n=1 Tax=Pomacea canaliculata TaxID=400727 RepID=A0A2T7PRC0_POMCA|nr:hypothetical protein C0Q70_02942 [Pomacea canaliculata]
MSHSCCPSIQDDVQKQQRPWKKHADLEKDNGFPIVGSKPAGSAPTFYLSQSPLTHLSFSNVLSLASDVHDLRKSSIISTSSVSSLGNQSSMNSDSETASLGSVGTGDDREVTTNDDAADRHGMQKTQAGPRAVHFNLTCPQDLCNIQKLDTYRDCLSPLGSSRYRTASLGSLSDAEVVTSQAHDPFVASLFNKIGRLSAGGELHDPLRNVTHVCHVYKGLLAVTDVLGGRIAFVGRSGRVVSNFVTEPSSEPWSSCVTPNGYLAVALRRQSCVTVWSGKGSLVREFGYGLLTCPTGIACDRRGRFVVTDDKTNMAALFTNSGEFITYLRGPGRVRISSDKEIDRDGQHFNGKKPSAVTFHIAKENNRTSSPTGNAGDDSIGTPYIFSQPRYVCVTASGKIVVSDAGSHSLKIFDPDGNFLHAVGSYGSGDGQLKAPYGVCSDQQENIFVADHYNNRVSVFTIDGKFIQHVLTSSSGLSRPKSVAVRSAHHRKLYVAHGGLRSTELVVMVVVAVVDNASLAVRCAARAHETGGSGKAKNVFLSSSMVRVYLFYSPEVVSLRCNGWTSTGQVKGVETHGCIG